MSNEDEGDESPAAALARLRWSRTTAEERSETMSDVARRRWESATAEEKKKLGQRLARARKRARAKRRAVE
jgi:hypothetical protein